jgi:RNA polymerase sigma factor (TIGR02999 family)
MTPKPPPEPQPTTHGGLAATVPADLSTALVDPAPTRPAQDPDTLSSREIPDSMPSAADLTRWLAIVPEGDASTWLPLFQTLYRDLRSQVHRRLDQDAGTASLAPATLSHEAWMNLPDRQRDAWRGRSPFLAVASAMLRQILVRHELTRRATATDRPPSAVTLPGLEQVAGTVDRDLVAVHDALENCADREPRAAKVVELRFFGGLENHEIAEALGLPLASVKRDWTTARTWLQGALAPA